MLTSNKPLLITMFLLLKLNPVSIAHAMDVPGNTRDGYQEINDLDQDVSSLTQHLSWLCISNPKVTSGEKLFAQRLMTLLNDRFKDFKTLSPHLKKQLMDDLLDTAWAIGYGEKDGNFLNQTDLPTELYKISWNRLMSEKKLPQDELNAIKTTNKTLTSTYGRSRDHAMAMIVVTKNTYKHLNDQDEVSFLEMVHELLDSIKPGQACMKAILIQALHQCNDDFAQDDETYNQISKDSFSESDLIELWKVTCGDEPISKIGKIIMAITGAEDFTLCNVVQNCLIKIGIVTGVSAAISAILCIFIMAAPFGDYSTKMIVGPALAGSLILAVFILCISRNGIEYWATKKL